MKKLLLLTSIFIATVANGQRIDSIWTGSSTSNIYFKPYRLDTMPVIMLVCDTAMRGSGQWAVHSPYVYWQFGYSVSKSWNYHEYLDDKKKLLPASVVVWMSKNK